MHAQTTGAKELQALVKQDLKVIFRAAFHEHVPVSAGRLNGLLVFDSYRVAEFANLAITVLPSCRRLRIGCHSNRKLGPIGAFVYDLLPVNKRYTLVRL